MSSKACEHCDETIGTGGGEVPPAKCGSGEWAPYGWCCENCAPTCVAMFGGSATRDTRQPLPEPPRGKRS